MIIKKLSNYDEITSLANKELKIGTFMSENKRGIVFEYELRQKIAKNIERKFKNDFSKEEINIMVLNIYISSNFDFYRSIQTLSKDLCEVNNFEELLGNSDKKGMSLVVNKLVIYHSVPKEIIISKIKEVLLHRDAIIEKEKTKRRIK